MASEFEPELERGKAKIADLQKKAEADRLELEDVVEGLRRKVFHSFGLDDFPNLRTWPSDLDEAERVLFKRFVSHLKKKLPKAVPYLNEFHFESREIDEASLSEMTRTPFGQYLYTDFQASASVCIPSFSAIKIKWDGRFSRENPLEDQDISVHLIFSYEKAFPETKIIYWEDEVDWDIVLVKAQEQCDLVAQSRTKGFLGLK